MAEFRLSYPGVIVATVNAATEARAIETFRRALDQHVDFGLIVHLDDDACSEERLYVTTKSNTIEPDCIEVEDATDDEDDDLENPENESRQKALWDEDN